MIFLVIGSIFSGYLLKDLFLGYGTIFWNNSFFFYNLNSFYFSIFSLEFFYKLFPFFLSIIGIFFVYLIYHLFNIYFYNLIFNKLFYNFYLFLSKGWYFNNLYNYFIGEYSLKYSYNIIYVIINKGILEYFGPLGFYNFFNSINIIFKNIHSGRYYSYILTMLYFIVFFLMFFITFFLLFSLNNFYVFI